jgi:hypothetical protein
MFNRGVGNGKSPCSVERKVGFSVGLANLSQKIGQCGVVKHLEITEIAMFLSSMRRCTSSTCVILFETRES